MKVLVLAVVSLLSTQSTWGTLFLFITAEANEIFYTVTSDILRSYIIMSHIWTFSSSSEIHLQRCLAAASSQDNDNKWIRQFKINLEILNKSFINIKENTIQDSEISPSIDNNSKTDISDTYDDFLDTIEAEPIHFDLLNEECFKSHTLATTLAERLSASAVEKLFNHIFNYKCVNNVFLEVFFKKFLPVYLKRDYTRLSLDLLIQVNKIYPGIFKTLLEILLNDLEISNTVLNDLTLCLNETEKNEFVVNLTDIELSAETFIHNLLTICTVYKDCIKTDKIQNYILTNLAKYSQSCTKDRNFGRLFLTFLQAEKALERQVDSTMIQDLLENHISPFKRPCAMILKDIIKV